MSPGRHRREPSDPAVGPVPTDEPVDPVRRRRPGAPVEALLALLGWLLVAVGMTWPAVLDGAPRPGARRPRRPAAAGLAGGLERPRAGGPTPRGCTTATPSTRCERTFAFSDNLLGYAPAGFARQRRQARSPATTCCSCWPSPSPRSGRVPAGPPGRGLAVLAAAVAGAAFAYAPWRWGQVGHLHVLSTGGIALTASRCCCAGTPGLLSRRDAADPARPPDRPLTALAGWAGACWQAQPGVRHRAGLRLPARPRACWWRLLAGGARASGAPAPWCWPAWPARWRSRLTGALLAAPFLAVVARPPGGPPQGRRPDAVLPAAARVLDHAGGEPALGRGPGRLARLPAVRPGDGAGGGRHPGGARRRSGCWRAPGAAAHASAWRSPRWCWWSSVRAPPSPAAGSPTCRCCTCPAGTACARPAGWWCP